MGVMRFIKAYFRRLGEVVRGQNPTEPNVSANSRGIKIGETEISWSSVKRLVAYKQDTFVGDEVCILIAVSDGDLHQVTERSYGWQEVVKEIEINLQTSLPEPEWKLRVMAAGIGSGIQIFPKTPESS
jgi:hypothetical protein